MEKEDMNGINEHLKHKLVFNFMYDDDETMRRLEMSLEKLKRYKLIQNPELDEIPKIEEPTISFGSFKASES